MSNDESKLSHGILHRRRLIQSAAALAAAAILPRGSAATGASPSASNEAVAGAGNPAMSPQAMSSMGPLTVAMLVHPQMVMLDLIGAQTFFKLMRSDIHLVWKDLTPVPTELGLTVAPNCTFADCPRDVDVLFVPGGLEGSVAVMDDAAVLDFLADRGSRARYVTSVCTGALVVGAAGLLKGYRATGHWYIRDLLTYFGATPVHERVVQDRNRMTGGGVTASIDFGLAIAIAIRGLEHAKHFSLVLEYEPDPPIHAGEPETAGPEATAHILKGRGPVIEQAKQKAITAARRLKT